MSTISILYVFEWGSAAAGYKAQGRPLREPIRLHNQSLKWGISLCMIASPAHKTRKPATRSAVDAIVPVVVFRYHVKALLTHFLLHSMSGGAECEDPVVS